MRVDVIDLLFEDLPGGIASFLLTGPSGHVLVETGPESTLQTLLAALQERGVEPEDLAAVFVTHIHLDHAGAAGWFAEKGVPVYVHPRGVRHLVDPAKLIESAKMVYGDRFDSLWGGMTSGPKDRILGIKDGEVVSVAGLEIEAVETYGHAFHHHAFATGDICFTGDSAGARLQGTDYLSVTSAPPQFDLEHTLKSIDRLAERNFASLYLTHFGEIQEVARHLKAYREAVEVNALFVKQRLEEGMDADSLQVAYQAFHFEQAFRDSFPRELWATMQAINNTDMCADGIRMYWEKQAKDET